MAEKDNIISLEDRLRRKEEVRGDAGQAGKQSDGEAAAEAGEAASTEPMPGKLVWLHCPVCDTLQYTEVVMGGGRAHNVCGTQGNATAQQATEHITLLSIIVMPWRIHSPRYPSEGADHM